MTEILIPPPNLFETEDLASSQNNSEQMVKQFRLQQFQPIGIEVQGVDTPERPSGIYVNYQDVPFPTKGWPFPEAAYHNNMIKRLTLCLVRSFATKYALLPLMGLAVTPFRYKIKILDNALTQYNRMAALILTRFYLKDALYCIFCRTLRQFIYEFLKNLGISEQNAYLTAKNFAFMLQLEDAYRYRAQDLFSETSKEKLLANPRRELKRLMKIFLIRTRSHGGLFESYQSFANLLSYAMFLPKIRKAFNLALEAINFKDLQFDEADRYHMLIYVDYDYFGQSVEYRKKIWREKYHPDKEPTRFNVGGAGSTLGENVV